MLQNGLEWKHKLILFLSMDSRWYQSYCIHLLIELTSKRKKKKSAKKGKIVSHRCYRQEDRAMWDAF